MKFKKVSLYLGLGLTGVCCATIAIAGLLWFLPIGGSAQKCTAVEVPTCSSGTFGDVTYLTYRVTNTCNYRLSYVKVVYSVYSISGDLLYDDVHYIEGLDPGEGKGQALTIPDNGYNYSCNAIVVEEGK